MDISKYNKEDFNSTYSPEDNKLRLYASVRLDKEHWLEMKANGWKWAPVQELFVAYWSLQNEDFCLALAGDILPEEMTLAERAELKANRLIILAEKRADQAFGYQRAATNLMSRIDSNQPILIGHASEKKQTKAIKAIERNHEKTGEMCEAVNYWVYRARSVLCHADRKNSTRTTANRIKTLLKDLRVQQKYINNAAKEIDLMNTIKKIECNEKRKRSVVIITGGMSFKYGYSTKIEKGEINFDDAIARIIEIDENTINSKGRARIISHILNRLQYEQDNLYLVPLYQDKLTPAILQTFLRTHGADKPKAIKSDYGFIASSDVCLPLHISSSSELELDDQEWRELMQNVGYDVPAKKVTIPILNFKTQDKKISYTMYRDITEVEQVEFTKEEYNAIDKCRRFTMNSTCGTFRFKVACIHAEGSRGYWDTKRVAAFINDSKIHAIPDSMLNSMLESESV